MTVRGPTSLHGFGPPASATDIFKSSPMTGALLSPPSRQTCSWMDRHGNNILFFLNFKFNIYVTLYKNYLFKIKKYKGRPASPPYDFEGRRSDRRERLVHLRML